MKKENTEFVFKFMDACKKEKANPAYQRIYNKCKQEMFSKYKYLVDHYINKYGYSDNEDLKQDAYLILMQGITYYDTSKNYDFDGYIREILKFKIMLLAKKYDYMHNRLDITKSSNNSDDEYSNEDLKIDIDKILDKHLNKNQSKILKDYFGLGGRPSKSMKEISEELHFCEGYTNQLKLKSLQKIKVFIEFELFIK